MPLNLPDSSMSLPLEYRAEPADTGHRMGGTSPVAPHFRGPHQRYFCTIEFDAQTALSIFYSFDITGADEARDVIMHNNRWLRQGELVHGVWHRPERRDADGCVSAAMTCHAIAAGAVRSDLFADDIGEIIVQPDGKIGGRPFVENVPRCGWAFDLALARRFRQAAQFATPNPIKQPYVEGFPWDPGWLHVLVREVEGGEPELGFVVQQ
ncbi:MAG TPA: hypothetical protein VEA69_14510 [Tepidisphaeraceae bacterium]|nr:hypothetical protein [Tepidisphaeraceae bacterium]